MAEVNTANVGFEKELWNAACVLRGSMDASDYKHVVLGLIFLKYISDSFEVRHQAILDEGEGDPEDRDEYTAEGVFFVPEEARWSTVSDKAYDPAIGEVIDNAMDLIEKTNPQLKGILPKNYARPELDKPGLGAVVNLFTNIKMKDKGDSRDILGRVYEYFLQNFAAQEGNGNIGGGEFFTPECIVRMIVEILKPFKGRIYDPACGSGGMFVQSAEFVRRHQGRLNQISIFGQEFNPTTWKLARMNLAIHGLEANLGEFNADTYTKDCHPTLRADFVMANPPFNDSPWGAEKLQEDVRWKYGVPPAGNANYVWMQHMIYHLAPNGKIGLVLANGALASQTGGEGKIRANIVNDDLVDCIVALPDKLFYSVSIPVTVWFLSRNKRQKGKTCFIDARKMGTMVDRKHRMLTDDDIAKIAKTFNDYEAGTLENQKGFCAVATTEQIAQQDYILTPGRYVGIEEQEDDGEPFEEKMTRLTAELSDIFAKSHDLEAQIKKNLKAIGFEVK